MNAFVQILIGIIYKDSNMSTLDLNGSGNPPCGIPTYP